MAAVSIWTTEYGCRQSRHSRPGLTSQLQNTGWREWHILEADMAAMCRAPYSCGWFEAVLPVVTVRRAGCVHIGGCISVCGCRCGNSLGWDSLRLRRVA